MTPLLIAKILFVISLTGALIAIACFVLAPTGFLEWFDVEYPFGLDLFEAFYAIPGTVGFVGFFVLLIMEKVYDLPRPLFQ